MGINQHLRPYIISITPANKNLAILIYVMLHQAKMTMFKTIKPNNTFFL